MKELRTIDLLQGKKLKVTQGRLDILNVLAGHDEPLPAEAILKSLGKKAPDKATVYRALETFSQKDIVSEVRFNDGIVRYELVAAHGDHCHHAVCTSCGDTEHIHDHRLEDALEAVSRKIKGFKGLEHSLEFYGLCSGCSVRPAKRAPAAKRKSLKK